MRLKTLGGLELEGGSLHRPQPLLLLAYLALEGPKDRQFLSELFWRRARDPRNSLSSTLTRIRNTQNGLVEANTKRVWTDLNIDAKDLLTLLERNHVDEAQALYRGTFLTGYKDNELGEELSEWIYTYREYLATSLRDALLRKANRTYQENQEGAARLAEQAYELTGAPELEPEDFQRIYSYLKLAKHPKAKTVLREAKDNELKLSDPSQARSSTSASAVKDISNNLTASKTSFIGRDQELLDIAAYLGRPDCQLLTLHGMGGIGKTRLAQQAAGDQLQQPHFTAGVFFISLENVHSTNLLFPTIANTLGFDLEAEQDVYDQLVGYIQDKNLLVVLDNFEHLVDAAPELSDLLRDCPNLKLLITSREILNLEEEWIKPIEGMRYPNARQSLKKSRYYEAIHLFMQRAKKTHPKFELSENNLPHLVDLCELTQALPLALELAAAWVKVMTVEAICKEVRKNVKILESTKRNRLERHHSIEAIFNYSWQKLKSVEKEALAKLAIFEGHFTTREIGQVANISLPTLVRLINKALIETRFSGRFSMHPIIRNYSYNNLSLQEKLEIETRHSLCFTEMLRSVDYWGEDSLEGLNLIEDKLPNIIKAIQWSAKNNLFHQLEGVKDIVTYFDRRNQIDEGISFFESILDTLELKSNSEDTATCKVLVNIGWLHYRANRTRQAVENARSALESAEKLPDFSTVMKAHNIIGWAYFNEADYLKAKASFEKALQTAIDIHDTERKAMYLSNLGAALGELKNHVEAESAYLRSVGIWKKLGSEYGLIPIYINLAKLYYDLDNFKEAITFLRKAELSATATKSYTLSHVIKAQLAENHFMLEHYELARDLASDAFHLLEADQEVDTQINLLNLLCRISLKKEDLHMSRKLYMQSHNKAYQSDNQSTQFDCLALATELLHRFKLYKASTFTTQFLLKHVSKLQKRERVFITQLANDYGVAELKDVTTPIIDSSNTSDIFSFVEKAFNKVHA